MNLENVVVPKPHTGSPESQVYQFVHGRAAIVTEIYLPAKYGISPAFLTGLEQSLLPEGVRKHFLDEAHTATILKYLPDVLKERYEALKQGLLDAGRCFGGYSIYDVKGAWRKDPKAESQPPEIERDANLCVRLVDTPDPVELFPADEALCGQVIRTVFALRLHHLNPHPVASMFEGCETQVRLIVKAIDTWIDQASLLLYGFVMCHVLESTGGRETEILLTSHFAVVNQYGRQKEEGHMAARTECKPDELEMQKGGKPQQVIVIAEGAAPNQAWAGFGYDVTVAAVEPADGQTHVSGVARFVIRPVGVGATTITFGIADGRTCPCKVLVIEAPLPTTAAPPNPGLQPTAPVRSRGRRG